MEAAQESISPRETILSALNDAASDHHAIKATVGALSGTVYAQSDFEAIGMYEALCSSVAALDRAVGKAMELTGSLPVTDSAH